MQMRENPATIERMKLEKDALQDRMEMQRTQIMEKGDIMRSIRCSHLERRVAEEKERYASVKETRDLRNRQIERTSKLAKELSRLKNLEAQELIKLRRSKRASQFSTTSSHAKERARLLEEKVRRDALATESLGKWCADKSFNIMQLTIAEEKKLCYRADLQNQIIEKRRILRELDEEKQRERKILEDTAEVLHEEDLREEMRKKELKASLRAENDAFFEARRRWNEILKTTLREENQKIGEVIVEKETRYKEQMEGKSDIRKTREAMTETIARKMLDEEIKMKEREDICNELYLETKKNEEMQESLRLLLEKQRQTKELQDYIVNHKIADTERKKQEQAMEEALTRYLYKEWHKLDELDRQKARKQRAKNREYSQELKDTIMNNRIEYAMKILKRQRETKNECEEKN